MRSNSLRRTKDRPFFLYVPHNMPHVPLHVSDKFKGKTERGLYGDVIMEIDWSRRADLAALKKQGLDEQTLVIFTSDNGQWLSYGDHAGSAGRCARARGRHGTAASVSRASCAGRARFQPVPSAANRS